MPVVGVRASELEPDWTFRYITGPGPPGRRFNGQVNLWHLLQALPMVFAVTMVVGGAVSGGLLLLSRLEATLAPGLGLTPVPVEAGRGR